MKNAIKHTGVALFFSEWVLYNAHALSRSMVTQLIAWYVCVYILFNCFKIIKTFKKSLENEKKGGGKAGGRVFFTRSRPYSAIQKGEVQLPVFWGLYRKKREINSQYRTPGKKAVPGRPPTPKFVLTF